MGRAFFVSLRSILGRSVKVVRWYALRWFARWSGAGAVRQAKLLNPQKLAFGDFLYR